MNKNGKDEAWDLMFNEDIIKFWVNRDSFKDKHKATIDDLLSEKILDARGEIENNEIVGRIMADAMKLEEEEEKRTEEISSHLRDSFKDKHKATIDDLLSEKILDARGEIENNEIVGRTMADAMKLEEEEEKRTEEISSHLRDSFKDKHKAPIDDLLSEKILDARREIENKEIVDRIMAAYERYSFGKILTR